MADGETVRLTVEVLTSGKREFIEAVVMRELDHQFRGRFTVHREDGSEVEFDPVLADGEPPSGYVPHQQDVVDHRPRRGGW